MGITAGPDGNVWFAEYGANNIGKITPGGATTEYPIPTPSGGPRSITAGPDGNLWFTEYAGKIGKITPSGNITEYTIPTAFSTPEGITAGSDGNLWFAESNGNKIGQITPSGTITEYPLPAADRLPIGIAAGPDGNVWFTEQKGSANKIGRITPSGTITEYTLPTASAGPTGITAGPDGNLWFTEDFVNKIGTLALANTGVQSDSVTVPAGTLSIALRQTSVAFGTVGGGASSGLIATGQVTYINTLSDGLAWSASVAATDLSSGASFIPASGLTLATSGYRRQPGPARPRPQEAAERSASPGVTASATLFTVCPTPARNRC